MRHSDLTKTDIMAIAYLALRVVGVAHVSQQSGPSFDKEAAVLEAIDRVCWELGIPDEEEPPCCGPGLEGL